MNTNKKKISPSLMCADFMNLGSDLKEMERLNIDFLHIDIMDGSFVPNYTLGTDFVSAVKKSCGIPLDIHLMIDEPENKLDWFDFGAGDYVSVHYEATKHVQRAIQKIKDRGAYAMLALNPGTPLCVIEDAAADIDAVLIMTVNPGFAGQKLIPQTIDKIKRAKNLYPELEIEADGNVSFENARLMSLAGADIFVAGSSSLFTKNKPLEQTVKMLRESIENI
ncbi:MAG: ribulose-phosphate 3-epimerase [Oscillospiraceae bacterium]|nr:ribulose-phosphate 3-epimerase [Oscillospiraceae bacterium]